MSLWTPEHVLALAPDAASVERARGLTSPSKWGPSGHTEHAVWGEALGSGSRPYQTAVDLREPAFSCTCPSPKFPCKHALALLLRFAQHQIPEGTPPPWVVTWLDARLEREAKKSARQELKKEIEADPVAAAKRAERRWQRVLAGLEECESFLIDIAGQGLLASQAPRSWDQMASRMVDAQASGVARRLRRLGDTIGVGKDWGSAVAAEMGNLTLLIEGARRVESLPSPVAADVRTALGIPTRIEDVDGERVHDTWDALGQVLESHDHYVTCRIWLRGRSTDRWALLMSSASLGQPQEIRVLPGTGAVGELTYYPSAWPQRAHPSERDTVPFAPNRGGDWSVAQEHLAMALAQTPWVESVPAQISDGRVGRDGDDWFVIDREGIAMKLRGGPPWRLLVQTGNQPAELFGEWDGSRFWLLGAWGSWGYLPL